MILPFAFLIILADISVKQDEAMLHDKESFKMEGKHGDHRN